MCLAIMANSYHRSYHEDDVDLHRQCDEVEVIIITLKKVAVTIVTVQV